MRDALRYFSSKDPYQAEKIEEAYEEQMERLRGAEQLPGGPPPGDEPEWAEGRGTETGQRRPAQPSPSPPQNRGPATSANKGPLKSSVFSQSNDVPDQQLLEMSK